VAAGASSFQERSVPAPLNRVSISKNQTVDVLGRRRATGCVSACSTRTAGRELGWPCMGGLGRFGPKNRGCRLNGAGPDPRPELAPRQRPASGNHRGRRIHQPPARLRERARRQLAPSPGRRPLVLKPVQAVPPAPGPAAPPPVAGTDPAAANRWRWPPPPGCSMQRWAVRSQCRDRQGHSLLALLAPVGHQGVRWSAAARSSARPSRALVDHQQAPQRSAATTRPPARARARMQLVDTSRGGRCFPGRLQAQGCSRAAAAGIQGSAGRQAATFPAGSVTSCCASPPRCFTIPLHTPGGIEHLRGPAPRPAAAARQPRSCSSRTGSGQSSSRCRWRARPCRRCGSTSTRKLGAGRRQRANRPTSAAASCPARSPSARAGSRSGRGGELPISCEEVSCVGGSGCKLLDHWATWAARQAGKVSPQRRGPAKSPWRPMRSRPSSVGHRA